MCGTYNSSHESCPRTTHSNGTQYHRFTQLENYVSSFTITSARLQPSCAMSHVPHMTLLRPCATSHVCLSRCGGHDSSTYVRRVMARVVSGPTCDSFTIFMCNVLHMTLPHVTHVLPCTLSHVCLRWCVRHDSSIHMWQVMAHVMTSPHMTMHNETCPRLWRPHIRLVCYPVPWVMCVWDDVWDMTHVLQCAAVCCALTHYDLFSTVFNEQMVSNDLVSANTLQHTATHCNTLRHTATHCNTLQHTATDGFERSGLRKQTAIHCNTLQYTAHTAHTATHCTTLHHTATHCTTLHHTATHCNTLQHTATHCNRWFWMTWSPSAKRSSPINIYICSYMIIYIYTYSYQYLYMLIYDYLYMHILV